MALVVLSSCEQYGSVDATRGRGLTQASPVPSTVTSMKSNCGEGYGKLTDMKGKQKTESTPEAACLTIAHSFPFLFNH